MENINKQIDENNASILSFQSQISDLENKRKRLNAIKTKIEEQRLHTSVALLTTGMTKNLYAINSQKEINDINNILVSNANSKALVIFSKGLAEINEAIKNTTNSISSLNGNINECRLINSRLSLTNVKDQGDSNA